MIYFNHIAGSIQSRFYSWFRGPPYATCRCQLFAIELPMAYAKYNPLFNIKGYVFSPLKSRNETPSSSNKKQQAPTTKSPVTRVSQFQIQQLKEPTKKTSLSPTNQIVPASSKSPDNSSKNSPKKMPYIIQIDLVRELTVLAQKCLEECTEQASKQVEAMECGQVDDEGLAQAVPQSPPIKTVKIDLSVTVPEESENQGANIPPQPQVHHKVCWGGSILAHSRRGR